MSILTRALQPAVNALWRLAHGKQPPVPGGAHSGKRSFDAAQITNLLHSWATDGQSLNRQLERELKALRHRSRLVCQNNEFARSFLTDLKSNVIGPTGIRFQCCSKNSDGTLDETDNKAVGAAFGRFSKSGEFEVSRRFDRATSERMVMETIARDGEAIIYKHPGFKNKSRFALRFVEPDYLDEKYSTDNHPGTGNQVRMGVEIDQYGAPVAYHFLKYHPGDRHVYRSDNQRIRVTADRIIHLFLPMYPEQARGVPWMHASLIGLRDLGGYREAALVAARVGAAKMGFFRGAQKEQFDGEDSAGDTIMSAEAGSFEHISAGTEFVAWDPQYPHGDFEPFNKALLRGIAAGLGMSYHKLSKDLEGVNYSSGRLGELSDRDVYMMLQNWLIEHFHEQYYPDWLKNALTVEVITRPKGSPLPLAKMAKWLEVKWHGRRWKWTDPQKEFNGIKGNIDERLMSRSQAIRDMGMEPMEVWREIADEEKLMESLGIQVVGADGFIPGDAPNNADTTTGGDNNA